MSGGPTNHRRCAACKYLRRRCAEDCILSPYFPASDPIRFQNVHKIFGASNVARMLQSPVIRPDQRALMANNIAMEAEYRVRDPVYGIAGEISILLKEICSTQFELAEVEAQIEMYKDQQICFNRIQNMNFGGKDQQICLNRIQNMNFGSLYHEQGEGSFP